MFRGREPDCLSCSRYCAGNVGVPTGRCRGDEPLPLVHGSIASPPPRETAAEERRCRSQLRRRDARRRSIMEAATSSRPDVSRHLPPDGVDSATRRPPCCVPHFLCTFDRRGLTADIEAVYASPRGRRAAASRRTRPRSRRRPGRCRRGAHYAWTPRSRAARNNYGEPVPRRRMIRWSRRTCSTARPCGIWRRPPVRANLS